MAKLLVENKALKLTNACICTLKDDDFENIDQVVYKMESYIRAKGAIPRGPLIQCSIVKQNSDGEMDLDVQMILQTDKFINKIEKPYVTESVIRYPDCIFVRYIGDEEKIHMAYDKLNLYAYEENIELTGVTYTIFIGKDGDFAADIFMEKK